MWIKIGNTMVNGDNVTSFRPFREGFDPAGMETSLIITDRSGDTWCVEYETLERVNWVIEQFVEAIKKKYVVFIMPKTKEE